MRPGGATGCDAGVRCWGAMLGCDAITQCSCITYVRESSICNKYVNKEKETTTDLKRTIKKSKQSRIPEYSGTNSYFNLNIINLNMCFNNIFILFIKY